MKHRFYSVAMLGLAFSASLYSLTRAEIAYGQAISLTDGRQAVAAYVVLTREIDQKAFSLKAMPDEGKLMVFRVVVTAEVSWISDIERVFDVYVDPATGKVAGEHSVRL